MSPANSHPASECRKATEIRLWRFKRGRFESWARFESWDKILEEWDFGDSDSEDDAEFLARLDKSIKARARQARRFPPYVEIDDLPPLHRGCKTERQAPLKPKGFKTAADAKAPNGTIPKHEE
ncbi:hypothetical protein DFP72DRAFT_1068363 [Ephemerocybe angulata]|uniref:Uncharacterized protein n=1 Tax=Ephemerocybe angulata TaxID=980116 RepID=A0A8H6HYT4_9AGAR|nr:hypothetical protein DFP72DRAFT_1068363 [Tulosesus angulatus]